MVSDSLLALDLGLPARFKPSPDGTLALEAVLAERKTFLSRQRLVYRARLRVATNAGRCASASG